MTEYDKFVDYVNALSALHGLSNVMTRPDIQKMLGDEEKRGLQRAFNLLKKEVDEKRNKFAGDANEES